MSDSTEFAVIGGGVIGASLAWGLARAGVSVAMIDGQDADYRASAGNFGLVWIQGKGAALPAYAALSHVSGRLWAGYAELVRETTGISPDFIQKGGFTLFASGDEQQAFEKKLANISYRDSAMTPVIMDRTALKSALPMIGDSVFSGCFGPVDGCLDPLALLRGLNGALAKADVRVLRGTPVSKVVRVRDGFSIIHARGELRSRKVIIAAGLGTKALAAQLGMDMPIRPQRGQVIVTDRADIELPYPTSSVRQTPDRTIMIGSTQDEVGYDKAIEVKSISGRAASAIRQFPFVGELNAVRSWGCLRIMTPDGGPVYQESQDAPGAYAIVAHSGVTMSSYHTLVVAPALAQGNLPAELSDLSLERYKKASGEKYIDDH